MNVRKARTATRTGTWHITAPLALADDEIHLWLADYEEANHASLHRRYRALLTDEERQQEGRFHFANDRRRYLTTRALIRTVLSRYAPVAPQDWEFTRNRYGRPAIVGSDAPRWRLKFNVSHTHSLIVLGIARGRAVGVDVEDFAARHVSLDLADRYFAPQEAAALATVPAAQQQYRFFEYWTFKEAYIKARGMGLSLPLDKFSFHYRDDCSVEMTIAAEMADSPANWEFWQLHPSADYLVAVCARRNAHRASTISMRQIVPMQHESILTPHFLRTST